MCILAILEKLGPHPTKGNRIRAVRGLGYMLTKLMRNLVWTFWFALILAIIGTFLTSVFLVKQWNSFCLTLN